MAKENCIQTMQWRKLFVLAEKYCQTKIKKGEITLVKDCYVVYFYF